MTSTGQRALPRVAFVVNGGPTSPMAERARAFATRLGERFDIRLFFRSQSRVFSPIALTRGLLGWRPCVCYVFDMAAAGVLAAAACKAWTRCRLVIDTGDAITALAWSLGRNSVGRFLTHVLERISLAVADRIVVRGGYHRDWLRGSGYDAEVIPDGVDMNQFAPSPVSDLRRQLGLDDVLTVGIVGSSVWSERVGLCYGWDLVELIRILRDRPVAGVIIGDGTGISVLQRRCRDYGIEGRVRFLGRVSFEQLPRYINLIDVCLSTQTDDLVGRVRTTGKLPLYLACGRFVLASRVGEAARVLPKEMLIEYHGTVDAAYPARLAERVQELIPRQDELGVRHDSVAVAGDFFDYDRLALRLVKLLGEFSLGDSK